MLRQFLVLWGSLISWNTFSHLGLSCPRILVTAISSAASICLQFIHSIPPALLITQHSLSPPIATTYAINHHHHQTHHHRDHPIIIINFTTDTNFTIMKSSRLHFSISISSSYIPHNTITPLKKSFAHYSLQKEDYQTKRPIISEKHNGWKGFQPECMDHQETVLNGGNNIPAQQDKPSKK